MHPKHRLVPFLAEFARLKPRLHSRRFQAFGIGLPRSGTHSIGHMLEASYRSAHEPRAPMHLWQIMRWCRGKTDDRRMRRMLEAWDRWAELEMHAAHYLFRVAPLLRDLFPDAKFVLTTREPYTWLESCLNQELAANGACWRAYAAFTLERAGCPAELGRSREPHPAILGAYLHTWGEHLKSVLREIPADRLLVLDVREIPACAARLGDFLGIDPATIDLGRSHEHERRTKRCRLLDHFDADELDRLVAERCGSLRDRLYPDARSARALLARPAAPGA